MAITLSTVAAETGSYWSQAVVLAVVGVGITFLVYGAVALIVKADDAGLALARNLRPASSLLGLRKLGDGTPSRADRLTAMASRPLGRALVMGMPGFLKLLGAVGTAAMLWVGGGILVHGLAQFGQTALEHLIHGASTIVGHTVPAVASGAAEWATGAAAAGLLGLAIGLAMIPLVNLATSLVARMRSRPKT